MGCTQATGALFRPSPPPTQERALVYLYFPPVKGSMHWESIAANGVLITRLDDGGYYPLVVSPGRITFSVDGREKLKTTVDVEAGRTYYIKLQMVDLYKSRYYRYLEFVKAEQDVAEEEIHECRLMSTCSESNGCIALDKGH